MAAYGVPPSLGVAPELMEEISTGVRDVPARRARARSRRPPAPSPRDSNTSRTETDPPSPRSRPTRPPQTTIMACQYKGGVVLGADSRTSTGTYVANRASDKITQVTDNVWMCRSGSVRGDPATRDTPRRSSTRTRVDPRPRAPSLLRRPVASSRLFAFFLLVSPPADASEGNPKTTPAPPGSLHPRRRRTPRTCARTSRTSWRSTTCSGAATPIPAWRT